jgi:threonine dehydrogenase-like Zn-dependent dehydrogenase
MKHSHPRNETMKAVQWEGKPFSVSINSVAIPKITNSRDAIIRITSSGICGSDLHVYHGSLPAKPPMTIGHEIVGIIHSIGEDVNLVKVGDRVLVSAIIDEDALEGAEVPEGLLGIGDIGGFEQFNGGQTSFVRVPYATENLLLLPPGKELELEYAMLADIFPTSNWALDCAGFQFGDVVVVFGAGTLTLFCLNFSHLYPFCGH